MTNIKVNRNFVWAEAFVKQLCNSGVRYVCISPGSRSAPLTIAFANEKRIKCFTIIDERSSAFFALGIAKATNTPVAVVTTSGTATAELYPAIIEAYQSRVPLIICTADRPPELLNSGANQTINQRNLYRNHIRWYKNAGLPELTEKKLTRLKQIANKAVEISLKKDRGPVHINLPFRKPLEPGSFTDEVDTSLLEIVEEPLTHSIEKEIKLRKRTEKNIERIAEQISNFSNGLIVVCPDKYDPEFRKTVKTLAKISGYPVLADGASHLRFKVNKADRFIISNYDSFLRSKVFCERNKPEIILQFGRTVTSTVLEEYLENSGAVRYLINEYGDWFVPSKKAKLPLRLDPALFCETAIQKLSEFKFKRKSKKWLQSFKRADDISEKLKQSVISTATFPDETRIVTEIISALPSNAQLFVGNSLPVRDLDYFAGKTVKDFKVYFNRGASGIDGVTSTTLGTAIIKKPTCLLTGDVSFIHDLNALIAAKHHKIPLTIILINNNGGAIFNMLPVARYKKLLNAYFTTPHNLDIASIVKSFGHSYFNIKSWNDLQNKFNSSLNTRTLTVLEIKTDANASLKTRRDFWNAVTKSIDEEFS